MVSGTWFMVVAYSYNVVRGLYCIAIVLPPAVGGTGVGEGVLLS